MTNQPTEGDFSSPEANSEKPKQTLEGAESQKATHDNDKAGSNARRRLSGKTYLLLGFLLLILVSSLILNASLLLKNAVSTHQNDSVLYLPLGIILAMATLVSVVSLMVVQYNRVVYLKNGPALVPEKWGLLVDRLVLSTKKLEMQLMDTRQVVLEKSSETESISDKLLESFLTLQEMISTRDLEIERLKKGYDSTVYRKFLRRFIRLERSLGIMEADAESALEKKNYRYLSRLLEDALEECGVEAYTPTIGSDYRNAGKEVADDPEELETDIEEDDFLIKQCVEAGFLLRGEVDYEVIKQAKVKITRFKPTV